MLSKNIKVMVVGDALIDNQYYVQSLPKVGGDEKIISRNISTGGSAANTALLLAKKNVDCVFCGKIGKDDFGKHLENRFLDTGVDISCLQYGKSTGYTLAIVDQNGERTMLSYRGASSEAIELTDQLKTTLLATKILLISGYLLTSQIQHDFVLSIIDIVKKSGGLVAFDPCPVIGSVDVDILKKVISKTDILLPNKQELLIIAKATNINQALDQLEVALVVVKLGGDGAMLRAKKGFRISKNIAFDSDMILKQKANRVKAVDTTGAGDAFNAGLLASIISEDGIEKWLKCANESAFASVTNKGAVI
jgi:ribokinase